MNIPGTLQHQANTDESRIIFGRDIAPHGRLQCLCCPKNKTNVFFTSREQFGRNQMYKVGMCVVSTDSIHESRLSAGRKNFEPPLVNPDVYLCVCVGGALETVALKKPCYRLTTPKQNKHSLTGSSKNCWKICYNLMYSVHILRSYILANQVT